MLNYYLPNSISSDTTTFFYKGKEHFGIGHATSVNEDSTHRLNFIRRNRPRYVGVDPNKFQGAFVRIWDRTKLDTNTLAANNKNMILNAYDVQEGGNKEGYTGLANIPDTAIVPCGLHEPYLIGNKLYLAGYNAGVRILDVNGSDLKLKAYCRTEPYLSDNRDSANFYARPDLIMYAKGIYRLTPDKWREGIVYGSDLYNGMWTYRYFDSTICDTIKHISFQPYVEIGTIDCNSRMSFIIRCDAIVSSESVVKLIECTKIKFDSSKKIIVDGELHIGAVDFDTTNINALSNIVVHNGGKAYIGEGDKTINGFHTMTIDSGGYAEIVSGSVINFMRGGIINVYGELQINSVSLNDQNRIVCKQGGKVVICSSAVISGMKLLTIENGGILEVKSGSITKLYRGGVIKIQGGINAALSGSEWAIFDNRFSGADKWEGIVFDSIPATSTQARTMSNIIIRHANTGITTYSDATYKSQPTITNCTITDNDIGITVFNDSPFLTYNKISHNITGLNGYYMSTVIEGNHIDSNTTQGAKLYHCGNRWVKNIVDYNIPYGYGIFADEFVTVPFNVYVDTLPYHTCDTTQGNSLRYNYNGMHVDDHSQPTFECDNSVHDNSHYDFIILDSASIKGYANYIDSSSLKVHRPDTKNTIFIWSEESPTETVFSKVNQKTNASVQRQPFDIRFIEAMNKARTESWHRRYSLATLHFKDALKYVHDRWEADQCLVEWQQTLQDAKLNRPSADPISQGYISGGLELIGTLTALRNSDIPKWYKNTCNEFLADQYMRSHFYTEALPLYEDLVSQQKDEPVLARRALMALVILKHRGLRDYESAYKIYEEIVRLYPKTYAVIFAKIDLGLFPLSTDDIELMKAPEKIEKEEMINNHNTNENGPVPNEYALYQCYPNPFGGATLAGNPSTTIKYELPFSSRVNLKIFNSLGVEVKTLINKEEAAGLHTVVFEGSSFSSGIYIYRLSIENLVSGEKKSFEKKMSLLK